MAAAWRIFRFLNSRFSTSLSAPRIGLFSENSTWSRTSCLFARPARLLYTHDKKSTMKQCNYLCIQPKNLISHIPVLALPTSRSATGRSLLSIPSGNVVFRRGVTLVSKKGKRKTCKAVAKRFIRTGKGKLKRWRCGYHHNQTKKSNRRKRFLRKPTYASKTQLRTLNKMLNGW